MKSTILTFCTLTVGCAAVVDADPIAHNGSTGFLNGSLIVATYEISSSTLNLPFSMQLPTDFKGYTYTTLVVSKTQRTGGWIIEHELKDNMLIYCIRGPSPKSAVTMALNTPYLMVAHNKPLEVSEVSNCK